MVTPHHEGLNFLGFTFKYCRDLQGRPWHYLNVGPSDKAKTAVRGKIKGLTERRVALPLAKVIDEVNMVTRGWKNYYDYGYPRKAFRDVNHYLQVRFRSFLNNRSQRKSKPFKDGETTYAGLKRMGLEYL